MTTPWDYEVQCLCGHCQRLCNSGPAEQALTGSPSSPSKAIPFRQLPIVVQDKVFIGSGLRSRSDLDWRRRRREASGMPTRTIQSSTRSGRVGRRGTRSPNNSPLPDPSVVPEFFGDTMLANGTVYPTATVQPTRYGLRILNACNARFMNLQLYVKDSTTDGITLNPLTLEYRPMPKARTFCR